MPYIRVHQRYDEYKEGQKLIYDKLPCDIEGICSHLAYNVFALARKCIEEKKGGKHINWFKMMCITKTLVAVADELKRRLLDPEEDQKISDHGDIE